MSKEPKRFKQTEIGELPEEWEVVRAEEDFEIIIGKTPSRNQSKYWDKSNETDNFWATIEDLKERFITTTKERVSDEGIKVARMRRVPEGTVLVSFKLTIGRVAIAGRPLYFNEAIAAFLPKSNCRFNRDFLFYALHLLPLWAEQQNLIDQAVKGVTLNKKKLQRLLLPLPPLEEQKRIAGVLRLVDKIAEETKRIINIYEKAKKFALKHLLTRGIGHTRFKQTEIGELPEEWEVVRLGDVATLEMEQIPVSALPEDTLYVGMEHIESNTGRLITDKLPTVRNIKGLVFQFTPDHILYGKLRPYLNKVWRPHFSGVCSTELVPIRCDEKQIDGNYLKFWLLSPMFVVYAKKFSEGTRMPRVNLKALINAPIPLPSLEEQKQIAEMLSTIDAAIENERRYLGVLEKCKKWMLDNLLTGKVRLPPEVDEILKGVLPDAF